jgi:hydrogenase expression/formation protein HypD
MMKFIDEFHQPELARSLVSKIKHLMKGRNAITLMEVCGTHTMSIFRFGIRSLLPANIRLLSGPGCPVCVTPNHYLDQAIAYSRLPGVIITTFGDMMRVPGSSSSLEMERSQGRDIRIVYSTLDAIKVAEQNPDKKVIFLGVGFETTSPTIASSMLQAQKDGLENYFILCAHKLIPPAMKALVTEGEVKVDGFICPAHVSTIIGMEPYRPLAESYNTPCVITGFEPLDILQGIYMLIRQMEEGNPRVENQYSRAVRPEGNIKARKLLDEVFESVDSEWRGLGIIPRSGYRIRDHYRDYNAEAKIPVEVEPTKEHKGCICGNILKGVNIPPECSLFARICTPESPVGACMVSSEGTCAAYYKYGKI